MNPIRVQIFTDKEIIGLVSILKPEGTVVKDDCTEIVKGKLWKAVLYQL